ncbi:uncharacterized protein [Montipora capricornis]|uniref:uncharacterized protein isoform X2 n=1 Tax=Montipora capricornis TaxID=246305 RepID=UPI0035F10F7F
MVAGQDGGILSYHPTAEMQASGMFTKKQTSSISKLSLSASLKLLTAASMARDSSSSCAESCKTPVAPREDFVVTVEDDDEQVVTCKRDGRETATPEKQGRSIVSDFSIVGEVDPSIPPGPPPLPAANTELRRGKSHVGGMSALENRHYIKHLTSAHYSISFESDIKTAVSRILGEKKPHEDRNRAKRLVIKRLTEGTKYFLKDSILISKSVIMEENVDKSRDRRAARRRQTIQQALRNQNKQCGVQRMRKLGDEIAFAKTIILPFPRRRRPQESFNSQYKPASQLSFGSPRLMRKLGSKSSCKCGGFRLSSSHNSGRTKDLVVDLSKFPQKGCLCFKCSRGREKAYARFFPPPRKRESMVQKYNSILAAKQRSTCSAPTLVAPVGKSQSSSVTIAMSFHSPSVSSDSSFEEKMVTCC